MVNILCDVYIFYAAEVKLYLPLASRELDFFYRKYFKRGRFKFWEKQFNVFLVKSL